MAVFRIYQNLCGLLFCLQLSVCGALGQILESDVLPAPAIYGHVPDSLFELEPDHDFPYEYLLKNIEMRFSETGSGIIVILEHHYRLKVYSDEPVYLAEAALVGIPYYHDQNMEEVVDIEAITHQPDGSVEQLDDGEIQSAELNSRYRIYEFMMPGVKKGSVIDYRYVTHRRYIDELPEFHFSDTVPTKLAHLAIHNEDYIRYDAVESRIDFDVYYHEELIDTSSIPLAFMYQRPEPISVEHWYSCNIPVIRENSYVSSMNDLRGKLKFQVSEFGRPRQPLENSWEYVVAQIRRSGNNPFVHADRMEKFRKLGKELAEHAESREESRDRIFRHVNENMTFDGMHRAFHETPPEMVLEGKPSDQAAVNLVLLAMLRGAGLEAWPVYLSDRNSGRINRYFPSVYQFSQMMVVTDFHTQTMLMDASFSNSRPGMIPVESFNENALIVRQDDFEWIRIKPEYSHFDLDVELKAGLSDSGDLTGTLSVVTGGYPAHEIREELSAQRTAGQTILEAFFDAYPNAELENAEVKEQTPGEYPLVLTADFSIPGYATSFREGLQFAPMVVGYLEQNPFQSEERSVPVTLDAPEILDVRYEITLPEGYNMGVSSQNHSTIIPGAELRENYATSGRLLQYAFEVTISRREFPPEAYGELRSLYERWVSISNDGWYIEKIENL